MKQQMLKELARFLGISTDLLVEKQVSSRVSYYSKGESLIHQGQLATTFYYVVTGSVRYFSVSEEGKEYTQALTQAPCIAGSTRAMVRKTESLISIEVLEDTLCLELDWQDLYPKLRNEPAFLEAYCQILENLFIGKEERENALVKESAEQRYLNFLATKQGLVDRVPLQYIASYIGITPVALSRIRKRLKA